MSVVPATLPAERLRGAIWASQLRSASDVVRDGGTVVGAPVFSSRGVTLDGVSDWLAFDINPTDWNKAGFSCKIRFTPGFAAACGIDYYFCDTTGGANRFLLAHHNSNSLLLYIGGTFMGSVVVAAYQAYWKANEENTIVITSSSGNTDIWLNGVQIMINIGVAWTPGAPVLLSVGANSIGAAPFLGTIHELKFYSTKLTDQEALDCCLSTQADSLLADWNMEDVGTGAWGTTYQITLSKESGHRTGGSGTQVLRGTRTTGAGTSYLAQGSSTVAGKRYRIRGWARGDGTSYPRITQSTAVPIWTGTTSTDWQYFDETFTAAGTYNRFYSLLGTTGNWCDWDDIRLMEDAHAPFDYVKDATVNLPMDLERGDPANVRTLDISGNGRDGTLGPGAATEPTKNTRERGYNFDGADDGISIAHDAGLNFTTAMTVSAWVKLDRAQKLNNSCLYIVGKGDGAYDEPFILSAFYSTGDSAYHTHFRVDDDTEDLVVISPVGVETLLFGWFLATGVYDGATVKLYINGSLVADDTFAATRTMKTNGDAVTIGCSSALTTRNLDADISDVKIWDIALTPMQIADLYVRESGGRHRL